MIKCLTCNNRFKIKFRHTFDIIKRNNIDIIPFNNINNIKLIKNNKIIFIRAEIMCKECKDDCINKFLEEYLMFFYIGDKKYFIGLYYYDIIRELNPKRNGKGWKAKYLKLSDLILKEF